MMNQRISRDEMYLYMAYIASRRSTCRRLKVGAILLTPGGGLTLGYNGAPRGLPHCDEHTCDPDGEKCQSTVHAEANAILTAARTGMPIVGSVLYCTHSPCEACARLIINSRIVQVIYSNVYGTGGIELLQRAEISVSKGWRVV